MQRKILKIFSIFTLIFFVMSITGAAATPAAGGKVVEVTKLDKINKALKKGPVLLRLGATWCPMCNDLSPTLKKLAKEYSGKATIMSVDVDKSPKIADYFNVDYMPDCSVIYRLKMKNMFICSKMGKLQLPNLRLKLLETRKKVYMKNFSIML